MVDPTAGEVDPRNFDVNFGWKEALGFQLRTGGGRWQKLWIRAATDKDVKDESVKGTESRYYQLQKARKERKLKYLGIYNPNHHKNPRDGDDQIGNSSFLKKVIKKVERPLPGAFNKRNRREDSESDGDEKEK